MARQICARFPGWQIEKVLLQETNRTVFRLRKGEQAAQLHAVCFADGAAAGRVASLWRETAAVRSYAAWVRRLCGIRDAECLALPVQCEVTPFSIRCGGRRVLVLQPGLTPLCRANRLPPDAAVMADVFQTVCRALLQCRVGGFPHGALVAANLLQRADGRYCLGGMLDPQRPEERGQPLPPESVELQRAALLMKELCGDSLQAETHDPGAMALQVEQYNMTKSLLFALSCSSFWIGMLNAIQEICKERTILKREYMSGLSLGSYLLSKIIVLGTLGLVQSLLLISTFTLTMGLPEAGVFMPPFAELFLTAWLTTLSATATGLFVSSLFRNPDRAMTAAPLLLMPQMLFSGLLFKLSGFTEIISWFAICRWSMEGFGTTANLNSLPTSLQQQGLPVPHEAESLFEYTAGHLQSDWGIMVLFVVAFLLLALLVLPSIKKQAK
ncbi:MAG: ABC transporter permease [Aristaeellaceae bacterium]